MKFITYIILIFIIGIIAAVLNLIEGIYFGLAVPTLNSVKIGNVREDAEQPYTVRQ